jgi:transaldolase/glucose-6-phosphate isomerase
MNPLKSIGKFGQSIWIDYIRRDMLASGELKRMIDEDGLSGLTSNPSIFQKAITESDQYDAEIKALAAQGVKNALDVFEALALDDIRMAADVLRAVYERSEGRDGFVSIEVSPVLAYNAARTVAEARQLFKSIDRDNVMIKVPATREGIAAIEQLTAEGINVNATLLFAIPRYEQVAAAYVSGLEKLAASRTSARKSKWGGLLSGVASVASFFVSRIDTKVDKLLAERAETAHSEQERAVIGALQGTAAIACSKIAYLKGTKIFSSTRFKALESLGARPQRLLWASTSTKNPKYRDVLYVEELIGPDTVNTIPPATYEAFRDHGKPRASLRKNVLDASKVLDSLARLHIDLSEVTRQLEDEGVKAFADSFGAMIHGISEKAKAVT